MNTLFKSILQWSFPLAILGIATPGLANVAVPVETIRLQLQEQTQVPLFIPTEVPTLDVVYIGTYGDPNSYRIEFNANSCYATACNFATLEVSRDGELITPEDLGRYDSAIEPIELPGGIRGQYVNICGPYCRAYVEWQYQGVVYSSSIKNGSRTDAIALARSTLANGVIEAGTLSYDSPQAMSCAISNLGMSEESTYLTSRNPGSRINVRAEATTNSAIQHTGYAGDAVRVMNSIIGESSYCWYNVEFLESGATGWVRGDFVTIRVDDYY